MTERDHVPVLTRQVSSRGLQVEWALAGFLIWLISLDTCLVCEITPEPIFVGYSEHESERGATERSK